MGKFTKSEQIETCTPGSRCHYFKECDYCASRRQAKIADVAEQLELQHGQLMLTTIKPVDNTAAAIRAVHASFMRRALAPAGIWTIETGELFGGLHLNILSPKPMAARWKGKIYSEILNGTAREAAAYISKRKGIPTPEQYAGRLYGSWGQIGAILSGQDMPPIVQGAAIEAALGGGQVVPFRAAEPQQDLSREQYRDIARRNLVNLRAYATERAL